MHSDSVIKCICINRHRHVPDRKLSMINFAPNKIVVGNHSRQTFILLTHHANKIINVHDCTQAQIKTPKLIKWTNDNLFNFRIGALTYKG